MCIRDSLWVKVVGRRTPRGQYHRRRACHAPTCGRASCRRPGGATRPCDKLVYLQAKFGGLISYGLSARLRGELLPLGRTARDQGGGETRRGRHVGGRRRDERASRTGGAAGSAVIAASSSSVTVPIGAVSSSIWSSSILASRAWWSVNRPFSASARAPPGRAPRPSPARRAAAGCAVR